jgi:hypothetical protein
MSSKSSRQTCKPSNSCMLSSGGSLKKKSVSWQITIDEDTSSRKDFFLTALHHAAEIQRAAEDDDAASIDSLSFLEPDRSPKALDYFKDDMPRLVSFLGEASCTSTQSTTNSSIAISTSFSNLGNRSSDEWNESVVTPDEPTAPSFFLRSFLRRRRTTCWVFFAAAWFGSYPKWHASEKPASLQQ